MNIFLLLKILLAYLTLATSDFLAESWRKKNNFALSSFEGLEAFYIELKSLQQPDLNSSVEETRENARRICRNIINFPGNRATEDWTTDYGYASASPVQYELQKILFGEKIYRERLLKCESFSSTRSLPYDDCYVSQEYEYNGTSFRFVFSGNEHQLTVSGLAEEASKVMINATKRYPLKLLMSLEESSRAICHLTNGSIQRLCTTVLNSDDFRIHPKVTTRLPIKAVQGCSHTQVYYQYHGIVEEQNRAFNVWMVGCKVEEVPVSGGSNYDWMYISPALEPNEFFVIRNMNYKRIITHQFRAPSTFRMNNNWQ